MTNEPSSPPRFDWLIYRNATLAGLSPLIPIPLVDWVFEEFFKRGIPASIARRQGVRLPPQSLASFNKGEDLFASCLLLPIRLVVELIKRLSRKLLYFLTIKESTDKVALYWYQAFLIDHLIRQGHLADPFSALVARQAMEQTLRQATTSPLSRLANEVVLGSRHIFRSLLRARRGEEDEVIQEKKARLVRGWAELSGELQSLASAYDQLYPQARQALIRESQARQ